LSQIQITLSRDTKFTHTCMRTHHPLVFILGHVTVYPLPIRLVASRIRHVAPPDLPVTPPDLPLHLVEYRILSPLAYIDEVGKREAAFIPKKTQNPTRVHPFLRTVRCHIVNFFGQCHMSQCQCVKKGVPFHVPLPGGPAFETMCHKLCTLVCGTCRCTYLFWTMCQKWCAAACATSRRTCFWSPF
jgi:hypothetical protein